MLLAACNDGSLCTNGRMQAWILALRVLVRCAVSESRLAAGVFEAAPSPAAAAVASIPSLLVLHRSEQISSM